MKKGITAILCSIVLLSCNDGRKKPDHLLDEQQMEDILYDISIYQSIRSFAPKALDTNRVDVKYYIFHKYDIDSTTFAQNNAYYAADLEQYDAIQQRVLERIEAKRDSLKGITPQTKSKPAKTPDTKVADSLRNAIKMRRDDNSQPK